MGLSSAYESERGFLCVKEKGSSPLTSPLFPFLLPLPPTQVSQWYELVVFTASMEIYGSAVADKLDNNRSILKRRYYRQVSPLPLTAVKQPVE